MKSIFKAVALITFFSVVTRLFGFVFRIYLSRKLGAEALGLYQVAFSVIGVLLTMVSSGLPLTTAKYVAKYETENNQRKKFNVVTSALVIAVTTSVVLCLAVYFGKDMFSFLFADKSSTLILIAMLPAVIYSAIYAIFRGAMWGKNNYFGVCITEFVEQVARILLTIILLSSVTETVALGIGTAKAFNIACAISALLALFLYFKNNDRLSFKLGEYGKIFKSAIPITGIRVASSFIQPVSALIIPAQLLLIGYSASEAVSAYGVMMGMTFPLLYIPMAVIGSLGMVLIPSISTLIAQKNYSQIEDNIKKSFSVSIFFAVLFVPLYLSVGDLIGLVLYNNSMSGVLLQYSSICVIPIALCNMSGSILNALNLEVKSFINYIIGACLMFACMFLFTRLLGINSLIISLLLCMTSISFLNIRMIKKKLPNLKLGLGKTLIKYLLIITPSAMLGYFVGNIMMHVFAIFVSCVFGGIISIGSTVLLANLFNVFKIEKLIVLKKMKLKMKKAV